jgi:proteic killer suppression protein
VDVRYADKKLQKLCTNEVEMRKKRADIADRLRRRVNALNTARTVGELSTHDPLGKWHQLGADRAGSWAGELSRNYRLLIRPDGDGDPWDAVAVTVMGIDDYH